MKEDYEGQGLERFWHTLLTYHTKRIERLKATMAGEEA
jgi:hypothetical protein